jgi:hypothetical protein
MASPRGTGIRNLIAEVPYYILKCPIFSKKKMGVQRNMEAQTMHRVE